MIMRFFQDVLLFPLAGIFLFHGSSRVGLLGCLEYGCSCVISPLEYSSRWPLPPSHIFFSSC